MKKHYQVLTVVLLILFAGCSMMGKKAERNIVGTWVGKGFQGSEVTYIFNEDMTMTMSFNMDGNEFTMNAKYVVDFSQNPVTIDLLDIEFPQGDMTISCLGIVSASLALSKIGFPISLLLLRFFQRFNSSLQTF